MHSQDVQRRQRVEDACREVGQQVVVQGPVVLAMHGTHCEQWSSRVRGCERGQHCTASSTMSACRRCRQAGRGWAGSRRRRQRPEPDECARPDRLQDARMGAEETAERGMNGVIRWTSRYGIIPDVRNSARRLSCCAIAASNRKSSTI